ncbi:bis(5'-nucleosyl)-tetraphosphatase (symmetrical) YqeK [Alkalibacterium olivapovliticus]|uniref:bis(5'-nucleosyl)-tetraphosphatase (symmetrical) n=1 Tax=Alkalibacterium olivapovliticus TaxID=99907 RepID=A0A2T0WB93_9LACT|nr:bis(5'-nucleosyl)-tetraphosphatase (symmetrical) YqeK [Alkalibacterium olivapovliticus]PRY83968.1 putative HD superfamily hydrolase involved in NAD metabolism [Alkalibacterium olivapovliticus]
MKNNKLIYSQNYSELTRSQLIDIMEQTLSKRRFKHILRVEKTALKLAERYEADYEKVSIAALAHDYAKEKPDEEMRDLIISENLDLDMLQYGSNIWHGPLGAVLMKNEYNIEDDEILEAIRYHTVGSPRMSKVAQIIYVADFIEPNRSFKGVEDARELAETDIKSAVAYISRHTISSLVKRNTRIYPKSIETYNAWAVKNKEDQDDSFVN